MHRKVRVLGIAPYDNMKALMLNLAQERDDIELTVFVGDLQQGVELAKRNFYNDYDAIVSRGGRPSCCRRSWISLWSRSPCRPLISCGP